MMTKEEEKRFIRLVLLLKRIYATGDPPVEARTKIDGGLKWDI